MGARTRRWLFHWVCRRCRSCRACLKGSIFGLVFLWNLWIRVVVHAPVAGALQRPFRSVLFIEEFDLKELALRMGVSRKMRMAVLTCTPLHVR